MKGEDDYFLVYVYGGNLGGVRRLEAGGEARAYAAEAIAAGANRFETWHITSGGDALCIHSDRAECTGHPSGPTVRSRLSALAAG